MLAFAFITRVYERSLPAVYLTALLISWVPVQLLALLFEGRRMWQPGQHSAVFFWGDSVLLPLTAVSFALLRRAWRRQHPDTVPLADQLNWRLLVIAFALAVALAYHSHEVITWPPTQVHAPSKLWHDFFVYPIFVYFLASQIPFLWQTRWKAAPARLVLAAGAAVLGVCGWWALGHIYDPSQSVQQRPFLLSERE